MVQRKTTSQVQDAKKVPHASQPISPEEPTKSEPEEEMSCAKKYLCCGACGVECTKDWWAGFCCGTVLCCGLFLCLYEDGEEEEEEDDDPEKKVVKTTITQPPDADADTNAGEGATTDASEGASASVGGVTARFS